MKPITFLFPCFFIVIASALAQEGEYSFKEKYTVSSPATLDITTFDGNIDVKPSSGNDIQLFYIARKNGQVLKIDREALEKEVILTVAPTSNGLVVTVKSRFENQNWSFKSKDQVHVSFKVLVPTQTGCTLKSSDGNIHIDGLTANQHLSTSYGNIEVTSVNGSITGKTSDGSVHIKDIKGNIEAGSSDGNMIFENIAGNVQGSTSDGNIDLINVKGDIYAKTSDGDINFKNISGSLRSTTSDGNIRGSIVDLKKELTARTSDGNIAIQIPPSLGLDLDIKGESLDVPLSNFSGKSEEKSIHGKCNGGGIAVSLTTSEGHVSLSHL